MCPIIAFERECAEGIPAVECDNYEGGRLATKRLIEAGRKNLLLLSGTQNLNLPAELREKAFMDVCREEKINGIEFFSSEIQFETQDYELWITDILLSHPEVDGVFATSDVIAAQVIRACHKLGRCIPRDISLIGFDDVEISALTSPSLTTIHQPIEQMCFYAIDTI